METETMSEETNFNLAQSAIELVKVAGQSRGEQLELIAGYLRIAEENGHTDTQAIDQILATPNYELIAGAPTLRVYAQAIRLANELGLTTSIGYGATYLAFSRIKRVSGYDLQATFAPIKKLTSVSAKVKALYKFNESSAVVNAERAAKAAIRAEAKNGAKTKADTKTKTKAAPLSDASPVQLAAALAKSLRGAKLSSAHLESVMSYLADIDTIVNAMID